RCCTQPLDRPKYATWTELKKAHKVVRLSPISAKKPDSKIDSVPGGKPGKMADIHVQTNQKQQLSNRSISHWTKIL
ncbi:MAG: hypothetical protein ACJ8DI_22450, partial [Ktedonobacteraceae bacterium]